MQNACKCTLYMQPTPATDPLARFDWYFINEEKLNFTLLRHHARCYTIQKQTILTRLTKERWVALD